MNENALKMLHLGLDALEECGNKDNYTLVRYADVACLIDRVYNTLQISKYGDSK